MIRCEITARNFEVDEKMKDYVEDKIGNLEKYLPRRVRGNLSAAVVLADDANGREDNRFVCEVVMTVNGSKMVSREGTVNIYAAIDIVEAKLRQQCHKYKEKLMLKPRRLRMIMRLVGRKSETDTQTATAEQEVLE
ncbi:MAG TPA: ribosome-associated translation inhibitor RaiA [Candidatus Saccharimonadia bacterium]|jgi:ribosomal subunit interface protein